MSTSTINTSLFLAICALAMVSAAPTDFEDCVSLPPPVNGNVQLVFSQSDQLLAVFICNQGYTAVGNTILSCVDGKWDEVPPLCSSLEGCNIKTSGTGVQDEKVVRKCGKLQSPRFGRMDTQVGNDGDSEIATFNCARGYYLVGSSAVQCEDGAWNGKEPKCEPVNCGEPAAPINGTVQYDDTTYLSRAHYKCDGCRLLNGYDHRICKRSGIWSKSVPECVLLDDIEACTLPDVPAGSFIPNDDELIANGVACSQVVRIRCFSGRRLEGADSATCNADGTYTWNGDAPSCKRLKWSR